MPLHFPNLQIDNHPLRPSRLFLDTEFTQFGAPGKSAAQLLSLALVDEHGNRYYMENAAADVTQSSTFVQEEVLPHLEGCTESLREAALRLKTFLNAYDFAVVHCDYRGDWDWLLWLLDQSVEGPVWPSALHHEPYIIDTRDWSDKARDIGESARMRWSKEYPQHHAYHDANGLRYVWQSTCAELGGIDNPASVNCIETVCKIP